LIKAWNAFISKKSVSVLKWAENEPFPDIEGAKLPFGTVARRREK
jgi:hypothetical protein